MNQSVRFQRSLVAMFVAAFLLTVFGCSGVRLIAEYDETIDKGITALQKKTEDLLSRLEIQLTRIEVLKDGPEKDQLKKDVSYDASEEFYREFRVELRVLTVRADSYVNNERTVKQLLALEEILKAQEEIHKNGFQTADDVIDMRNAFTRGFKGILKLEIAKKRGQE